MDTEGTTMTPPEFQIENSTLLADYVDSPGRWFTIEGVGTVWTDDKGVVTIRPESGLSAETTVVPLNEMVAVLVGRGRTIPEVFDEAHRYYLDLSPEDVSEVGSGYLRELRASFANDPLPEDSLYGFTADDTGEVLEFYMQTPEGTYLLVDPTGDPSELSSWERIDPDLDEDAYPTYYGQQIFEVQDHGLYHYVDLSKEKDTVTVRDLAKWTV